MGWSKLAGSVADNNKTSGAQVQLAAPQGWATGVAVGDTIVFAVTFDNTTATTPTITSPTKHASEPNSWVRLGYVDSPTATASAGVRTELWALRIGHSASLTASFSTQFSAIPLAKAAAAIVVRGGTLTARTAAFPRAGSTSGTQTLTGVLPGDLLLGVAGTESNAAPATDSDTTGGTWSAVTSATSGGGGAANVALALQWKIPTASGTQSLDASVSDGGVVLVALQDPPQVGSASGGFTFSGFATGSNLGEPLNLAAAVTGPVQITVSWTNRSSATGYDVERDGVVIATDHPSTPYVDSGLEAETQYSYRVRSRRT